MPFGGISRVVGLACALGCAASAGLIPNALAQSQLQAVDFAANQITIRHGDSIGRLRCSFISGTRELTWETGIINEHSREFASAFFDTAAAAGLPTPTSDRNLFVGRDSSRPNYLVGSSISKMTLTGCRYQPFEKRYLYLDGTITIAVDWEVFSLAEDRVVHREQVLGNYKTTKDTQFGLTILHAYRDSARRLFQSAGFRRVVAQSPGGVAAAVTAPVVGERWLLPALANFQVPVAQNIDYVRWATVTIDLGRGSHGSGFFLTQDGWIMTNAHVASGNQTVKVVLADGRFVYGQVARHHAPRDVALIKIDGAGYAALPLRVQPVAITEEVFAIGTPVDKKLSGTVTRGIVSRFTANSRKLLDIQADVTVHGGSSGGPLIDAYGNVVGISYAGVAKSGRERPGLNLFIPIMDALEKLNLQLGGS